MPQAPPARQFRRPRDPPPWATTTCCRESAALGHHRASLGELALAGLGLELEMNEGARDGRETGERRSKTGAERLRPSNFEGRSEPASRRYILSGAAPLPPLHRPNSRRSGAAPLPPLSNKRSATDLLAAVSFQAGLVSSPPMQPASADS
jgi:hypothetical protein